MHLFRGRYESAWRWVPSLYLMQGLPYAVVMSLSLVLFRDLGISNADIAWMTAWLYLPWVIKPLWSPFLALIASERRWALSMQALIALGFVCLAAVLAMRWPYWLWAVWGFLWLIALASATHDVAADGFYLRSLDQQSQASFVGVRSLAFRLAMLSVSGGFVGLVGMLLEQSKDPFDVWSQAFLMLALGVAMLCFWHGVALPGKQQGQPKAASQNEAEIQAHAASQNEAEIQAHAAIQADAPSAFAQYRRVFVDFFKRGDLWPLLCFLLFYRFSESQLLRLLVPFLMDAPDKGGLGLSHGELGVSYGGLGVLALSLGGLGGGYCIARWGLRRLLWPMACCLNVPNLAYALLSWYPEVDKYWAYLAITAEQFGYGFGFAAYLVFMMRVSEGKHATAHYAICTGFMALGMMVPGMPAGWIQMQIGYAGFFVWVLLSVLPSLMVVAWVIKRGLGLEPA
jgi:PAT family beta-lactamase induction signal transducer AmpG